MCFTSETWHMGFPSGEKLRVFHTDHWQAQGIIFKCARMPSPYPKRLATQTDVYIDIVLTINGTPNKNNHSSCIDVVNGSHISSQFHGQSPQIYTLINPSVRYKDVHIVWQLHGPLLVELSDWSLAQVHVGTLAKLSHEKKPQGLQKQVEWSNIMASQPTLPKLPPDKK